MAQITEWMDFAHGEDRGYAWIDELRRRSSGGIGSALGNLPVTARKSQFRSDTRHAIPSLQRLVARTVVLQSHAAQYELLAAGAMRPSVLQACIAAVPQDQLVGGCVVLAPAQSIAAVHAGLDRFDRRPATG